jgi:hypothetical protein
MVIVRGAPILGVDVGEDYLDLALLTASRTRLSYHRVRLAGIANPATASVAQRIADAVDHDLRGGVALVDSPRTPRDVDCSGATMSQRANAPHARAIDASLRELLRARFNAAMRPLSMFPTPLASYFAGCVAHPGCKPHLRAIAEELLAPVIALPRISTPASLAGGTFTRFMLAGFAVFPALEQLGIRAFEAFPDLQMRLWSDGAPLPPKRLRNEALLARRKICARLAAIIGVRNFENPKTLDEADAAVLALSAAASASAKSLIELHCAQEGRFAVAFKGAANEHHA